MKRWLIYCSVACLILKCSSHASETVTVYAAASLGSALQALAPIAQKRDISLQLSLGGSSTMAKQIAQGAPADIFISANVTWMDFLARQDLIEPHTRVNLLANTLVFITPKNETLQIAVRPNFNFPQVFTGRLALGDPSHVPAGIYAKQALEHLGWWANIKNHIAPAMDVRGALALVERGECPIGIVYATDATLSPDITPIAAIPDSLHNPIQYPMAIVRGRRSNSTEAAMRFLQSNEATAIFRQYGFRVLTHEEPSTP